MAKLKRTPPGADQTCGQITALVLGYLTRTLSANVKRDFEHHLTLCPDCVNFLNTYKKTVAATKSVEPSDIPAPVRDSILSFLRKRTRRIGVFVICILAQYAA